MSVELKRIDPSEALVAEATSEFAEECRFKLNVNLGNAKRDVALAAVLKCGVVPFDPVVVERYKQSLLPGRRSDVPAFAITLFACWLLTFWGVSQITDIVGVIFCALLFGCMSIACALLVASYFQDRRDLLGWQRLPLSNYAATKSVPEFALQTALAIRNQAITANLWVEALEMRSRPRAEYDPFLGVTIDGQDFYLEVWNEPKFKQERVV